MPRKNKNLERKISNRVVNRFEKPLWIWCRKHHIALHRLEESKNPELVIKLFMMLIEHGDSTQNFISHANIVINQLMKYEQPNKDHEQIGYR